MDIDRSGLYIHMWVYVGKRYRNTLIPNLITEEKKIGWLIFEILLWDEPFHTTKPHRDDLDQYAAQTLSPYLISFSNQLLHRSAPIVSSLANNMQWRSEETPPVQLAVI